MNFLEDWLKHTAPSLGPLYLIVGSLINPRTRQVRLGGTETYTVAMFHSADLKQARQTLECFLCACCNSAADLEVFVEEVQPDYPASRACRKIIRRRIRKLESYLQIHAGNAVQMPRALTGLALNGGNIWQGSRLIWQVLWQKARRQS
jgi:hypothetical protein